jgi:hypothetical protein
MHAAVEESSVCTNTTNKYYLRGPQRQRNPRTVVTTVGNGEPSEAMRRWHRMPDLSLCSVTSATTLMGKQDYLDGIRGTVPRCRPLRLSV